MIVVLRLNHRIQRDARLTTHVCLTSRAFGADKVIFTGDHDEKIINSVQRIVDNWGGPFDIEYKKSHKPVIKEYKEKGFTVVHLTMYGLQVQEKISEIRDKDLLIIVGGEKVPGDVYQEADYNISVTTQPHSEVAALSIILHQYFQGKELEKQFKNAKKKIQPSEKGKSIIDS